MSLGGPKGLAGEPKVDRAAEKNTAAGPLCLEGEGSSGAPVSAERKRIHRDIEAQYVDDLSK
jgi:hypothetical protein